MTDTYTEQELEVSEIDSLKQRATDMGIKYSPNIGLDKLREKVNGALAVTATPATQTERYSAIRKEATKLIRVRITCLNPAKKEFNGEWFRIGNSVVKTITRFVPFELETHAEAMLLPLIRSRKYAIVTHEKGKDGFPYPVKKLRPEFQIEELPALTATELHELAAEQAKRGSVK